ncbi:MAG: hypothetical protein ACOCUI_03560 [bacterium]
MKNEKIIEDKLSEMEIERKRNGFQRSYRKDLINDTNRKRYSERKARKRRIL